MITSIYLCIHLQENICVHECTECMCLLCVHVCAGNRSSFSLPVASGYMDQQHTHLSQTDTFMQACMYHFYIRILFLSEGMSVLERWEHWQWLSSVISARQMRFLNWESGSWLYPSLATSFETLCQSLTEVTEIAEHGNHLQSCFFITF